MTAFMSVIVSVEQWKQRLSWDFVTLSHSSNRGRKIILITDHKTKNLWSFREFSLKATFLEQQHLHSLRRKYPDFTFFCCWSNDNVIFFAHPWLSFNSFLWTKFNMIEKLGPHVWPDCDNSQSQSLEHWSGRILWLRPKTWNKMCNRFKMLLRKEQMSL